MEYCNPVIRGFYPDPSICKKDGTYYLVCSSFQYFPGVPLFESKDLINWKQLGYVLDREKQLPLKGAGSAGGIYAPTIRCHNGRFYMVTTNVAFGHFYVWTDNIYGSWSDPIWVAQEGIDPSLYFEEDRAYFMSNGNDDSDRAVVLQCEIDIETGAKLTDSQVIWYGAGGRYLESPHLYRIKDHYYLMAAEGGTEYGHMVVYARGDTPYGPFENYKKNPVLTNRNLGGYLIQGVGHGDLISDERGNWWMVHLAFRQIDKWQTYHHLGREVCLVPITFDEEGWFHAGEAGITPERIQTDRISENVIQEKIEPCNFNGDDWQKLWCYIRNPKIENYSSKTGSLALRGTTVTLSSEEESPTFFGIRQREMSGQVSVSVEVASGEAGISIYMDEHHHYDFALVREKSETRLIKRRCVGDMEYIQQQCLLSGNKARLVVDFTNMQYSFWVDVEGTKLDFKTAEVKYLSTEVAGGFTGVMIGLYAVNEDLDSCMNAHFRDFECKYEQEEKCYE